MKRRNRHAFCVALLLALVMAACSSGGDGVVIRSDIQPLGMDQRITYKVGSTPDGSSEINRIEAFGTTGLKLRNTFSNGAGLKTQSVEVVHGDGRLVEALNMTKPKQNLGATNFLKVEPALYEARDAKGSRVCGVKVRQQFQRNIFQILGNDRDWDALWYYTMPCPDQVVDGTVVREVDHSHEAKFYALVINEQWQFRFTGDPLFINRGHSVTIVDGLPSRLQAGWWDYTRDDKRDDSLDAANLVRDIVLDLDSSAEPWLQFKSGSRFGGSQVVYSAGDADVYASFRRVFLNRQTDYVVNYRLPNGSGGYQSNWQQVVIRPVYNFEWNDLGQNVKSISGQIKDLVNDEGVAKDPHSKKLKELERAGCQNCPNPTLEQIQFIDGQTGAIRYAMTIRAFYGAEDTLVMFGPVQPPRLSEAMQRVETEYGVDQTQKCQEQVRFDEEGEKVTEKLSDKDCTRLLREGALWNWITTNPDKFGFDLVAHFRVRDNSTWAAVPCSGDGGGTCGWDPIATAFDASYKFNTSAVEKAWSVMQLLGEVGVRTLGMTYASGKNQGTGLIYAMEQQLVYNHYFTGVGAEDPFILDSRADQLPGTLAKAHKAMGG